MVDYARSCYRSRWHPFADDLSRSIGGRYFFAPLGTPHYPGFHRVGSRDWYDSNWEKIQGVGESLTAKHGYDPGAKPIVMPLPVLRGSAACVANGEQVANGVNALLLVNGFLTSCYVNASTGNSPIARAFTTGQCATQRAWAWVIGQLYAANWIAITAFLRDWLGTGFNINFYPANGNMPNLVTLIAPTWSVAVCAGTQGYQTLALEAWQGKNPPVNFGAYATMPLWETAAQYVNGLLAADGANPAESVLLIGHSYGGALSTVLAAKYKLGRPNRLTNLLTYGCPKVGDARLLNVVNGVPAVHVVNDDDFVCVLPPSASDLAIFAPVFGQGITTLWGNWFRPEPQTIMANDGTWQFGTPIFPDYQTMIALITACLNNAPLAPWVPHQIDSYVQRLNRRCPQVQWPLPPDGNAYLGIPDVYHLALLAPNVGHHVLKWIGANIAADGTLALGGETFGPDGTLALGGETFGPDGTLALGGETFGPDGTLALGGETFGTDGVLALLGESEFVPDGVIAFGVEDLPADGVIAFALETFPPLPVLLLQADAPSMPTGTLSFADMSQRPADGTLTLANVAVIGPGATCSAAMAVNVTWSYSGTAAASTDYWFVFPVTSGTTYKVRFTGTIPFNATATVSRGSTCGGLTTVGVIGNMTPCTSLSAPATENWYVRVSGPLFGSYAYNIEGATGSCP